MTIITKSFNWPEYADKYSSFTFKDRCAEFGKDVNGNLYFKGAISGHSYETDWIKVSQAELPFDLRDMQTIVMELS